MQYQCQVTLTYISTFFINKKNKNVSVDLQFLFLLYFLLKITGFLYGVSLWLHCYFILTFIISFLYFYPQPLHFLIKKRSCDIKASRSFGLIVAAHFQSIFYQLFFGIVSRLFYGGPATLYHFCFCFFSHSTCACHCHLEILLC